MTYNNPAVAAIAFALETDDEITFLRCWFSGDFDVIRREWPDAPEEVFIGADLLHPQTKARLGEIERLQREVINRNARALEGDKAVAVRELLLNQIEASQAREAKLRDALMDGVAHLAAAVSAYEKFVGRADRRGHRDPFFSTRFSDFTKAEERTRETLSLPHDDTALKERLKAERERCAKYFEDRAERYLQDSAFGADMSYHADLLEYAEAIRNLGDE